MSKKQKAVGNRSEWPLDDPYVLWAMNNIYQFWVDQDEWNNTLAIEQLENLYESCSDGTCELKKSIKQGLELLYAERREIRLRKDHLLRKAGKGVLKWN